MKKILLILCFLGLCIFSYAQQSKLRVAVLDPTTSGIAMDDGTKLAVQELISSTFVNTGRYIIIERSMIDKIIKEQSFQNSDIADNSQATEIGKLAGANKVVLSAVSLVGGRNMLSIKIIDVTTASIDKQRTKIVGSSDLLDAVEPLTLELLGEQAEYVKQNTIFTQTESPKTEEKTKKDANDSSKKKSPNEINNSKFDYESEYKVVCKQLKMGIESIMSSSDPKLDKLFTQGKLKGQVMFASGFSSTLSNNGVLTIKGSGRMVLNKEPDFASQLSNAKVILIGEGITEVCGLSGRNVQYVQLPNTLEVIDDECFKNCSKLNDVNIPSNVNRIGKGAFEGCKQLTKMIIPPKINSVGESAFEGCESLLTITLPNSITVIPNGLFKNCKSLREVYISNNTTTIGKEAFYRCESIQKFYLPSSVVSIGDGCFQRMQSLYDIQLSEKLTMIPSKAFADCKSLTKVICPANVKSVGNDAFASCENLIQISFLSENISEFGEDCFDDCKSLGNIILYSMRPPNCPKEGIFDGEEEYLNRVMLTVHPAGLGMYKKDKFWKNFKMITTISQ